MCFLETISSRDWSLLFQLYVAYAKKVGACALFRAAFAMSARYNAVAAAICI